MIHGALSPQAVCDFCSAFSTIANSRQPGLSDLCEVSLEHLGPQINLYRGCDSGACDATPTGIKSSLASSPLFGLTAAAPGKGEDAAPHDHEDAGRSVPECPELPGG